MMSTELLEQEKRKQKSQLGVFIGGCVLMIAIILSIEIYHIAANLADFVLLAIVLAFWIVASAFTASRYQKIKARIDQRRTK